MSIQSIQWLIQEPSHGTAVHTAGRQATSRRLRHELAAEPKIHFPCSVHHSRVRLMARVTAAFSRAFAFTAIPKVCTGDGEWWKRALLALARGHQHVVQQPLILPSDQHGPVLAASALIVPLHRPPAYRISAMQLYFLGKGACDWATAWRFVCVCVASRRGHDITSCCTKDPCSPIASLPASWRSLVTSLRSTLSAVPSGDGWPRQRTSTVPAAARARTVTVMAMA